MTKKHWYIIGCVILASFLFQTFYRYNYTKMSQYRIVRIDRLTGNACDVPCLPPEPAPSPTPEPTSTPFDRSAYIQAYDDAYDDEKLTAIQDTKNSHLMDGIRANNVLTGYTWIADPNAISRSFNIEALDLNTPAPHESPLFSDTEIQNKYSVDNLPKTMEVRYQDKKGIGWSWEWHRDSRAIYFIYDNADLMKKYGYK